MIDYTTGKIVRPGSINRVINYVANYDDKRERKWEFQSPKASLHSIITEPHLKHFHTPKTSKEIQKFAVKKIYPQPNSKRIILSNLLPETKTRKLIPIKRVTEVRKEYQYHKKRGPEHLYNNNFTLDNSTNHKYLNISPCTEKRYKRSIPLFNEYTNTSQITLLPGSIKRKAENIDDDLNRFIKKKEFNEKKSHIKFNTSEILIRKDNDNRLLYHKKNNYSYLNKNIDDDKIKRLRKQKTALNIPKIKRKFKIPINDNFDFKDNLNNNKKSNNKIKIK
jgi:hypothetical protein